MNSLELKLKELNPSLFGKLNETKEEVKLLLNEYNKNFPYYTDHSIHHTEKVFEIVSQLLTPEEINNLNDDEIYILSMSSYLHDVGMCIPEEKIKEIADTEELIKERELHPNESREKYLRDIHHTLSKKFILEEWELLKIPNEKYAEAIGLVSEGHRIVDIGNPEIYDPKFTVKSGRDFVCLPYLSAVLRIADELDITNIRTPKLLTKYYMPDNEKSVLEWNKHIANTLMFITENYVLFEVKCSNHSMLAALEDQFNKIGNVINYCQKVIRNISNTENRKFSLKLEQVKNKITYIDFDPKGIKYSFDVDNVINAFVGENLYNDKLTSLRELLQNSIDTCRYKKVLNPDYTPEIKITIDDKSIKIEDNGLGMDEFIIKNYFGKLGSSFYQQESVKKDYDAIGQFGVGVFSYFLMADYIDIETKTKDSETLHFRLDKDPKNYFHFFKNHKRKSPGTTITLNLKKEFLNYNENSFIDYIKDKFRYIEFPISIIYSQGNHKIASQNYEDFELKNRLVESLMHRYKLFSNDLEIFSHNFLNENYEGSISLVYLNDLTFPTIGYMLNDTMFDFRSYNSHYRSNINFCQKGVLINSGNDFTQLSDLYCNLNLKQKVDIQISRNNFSDISKIENIVYDITCELFYNFFEKLNNEFDPEKLAEITFKFIDKKSIRFKKNIFPKFYYKFRDQNKNYSFISFEDFLKKDLNSIIICLNNVNTISIDTKINNQELIEFYVEGKELYEREIHSNLKIFLDNNYTETLVKEEDFYFLKLVKGLKKPTKMNFMWSGITFILTINIDKIIIDKNNSLNFYDTNTSIYHDDFDINYNHPFVLEIFKYENTDLSQKLKELINEIFILLSNFDVKDSFNDDLQALEALQNEIKNHITINYELSIDDFPVKI